MSGADALLGALLRMSGGTEADIVAIRKAVINRLRDFKAMAVGGRMADGTELPGQAELLRELRALRFEVAKLTTHSTTGKVVEPPTSTERIDHSPVVEPPMVESTTPNGRDA